MRLLPPALPSHRALRLAASGAALLGWAACARAAGVSAAPQALLGGEGGLAVTNAMITSAFTTGMIILLVRLALRGRPRMVPTRAQGVLETVIEGLRDLLEPIVGRRAMPAAFPLLLTFFLFILLNNWSGLIPFVGTVGWEVTSPDGHHGFVPWIRPHTSDFNGTIALALVSFGAWLIIVLRFAGLKFLAHEIFGNKADRRETPGLLYAALSVIFLLVGAIDVVSILIRPLTLSVRLFGNIFGGETLLHETSFAFPFYFLELLVGFVQALVFTLLSAVYIGLICNHGDDHEHGHAAAGAEHPGSGQGGAAGPGGPAAEAAH